MDSSELKAAWQELAMSFDEKYGIPIVGNQKNTNLTVFNEILQGQVFIKGVASEKAFKHELKVLSYIGEQVQKRKGMRTSQEGATSSQSDDEIAVLPLHSCTTPLGHHIICFRCVCPADLAAFVFRLSHAF
jgi:hypothetical protein